jgi:hypothetical protein
MWEIEYRNEIKFYFIDNDPYTFALLIKIEELRHHPDAIPREGCTQIDDGLLWWETLEHIVIYERVETEKRIIVVAIKPM